jgi:hypothetical protein
MRKPQLTIRDQKMVASKKAENLEGYSAKISFFWNPTYTKRHQKLLELWRSAAMGKV